MGKFQLVILWVGISVGALMGLYPPWVETRDIRMFGNGGSSQSPAGYGLLWKPPEQQRRTAFDGIKIDMDRLLIQWAVVATITGGLVITLKPR